MDKGVVIESFRELLNSHCVFGVYLIEWRSVWSDSYDGSLMDWWCEYDCGSWLSSAFDWGVDYDEWSRLDEEWRCIRKVNEW